ncbi:hypothetical protein [Streptomyces acidiscabies]|nr:hypothetical protein [Streptomyces acidiscabies]
MTSWAGLQEVGADGMGHEAYSWGGGAKAHRGSVAWWVTEQQITDE